MIITLSDLSRIDGPILQFDTDTGKFIVKPSGQRGGQGSEAQRTDDIKRASLILKYAIGINDHQLRKTTIQAVTEYLVTERVFGAGGNVVLIMDDDHGPELPIRPLRGTGPEGLLYPPEPDGLAQFRA
jgi:hypothetical protein